MSWGYRLVGREEVIVPVDRVRGKARPRFDRRNGRTYTPTHTLKAEREIRHAWRTQVGAEKWASFPGVVALDVTATRQLPKSAPKRLAGRADTGRPDADNVLKLVADALLGLAYADDSHVTDMRVTKSRRPPHGTGSRIVIRVSYYQEEWNE